MYPIRVVLTLGLCQLLACTSVAAAYSWSNVKIGGGGGFVPGIIFNPKEKGLAYARTDIGGAYRLNADDTWTPLLEFVDSPRWNYWGVDALATDPVDPKRVYLATGMYTNSWDPNNGQIMASTDKGNTWKVTKLPFKIGGNMPGRGMGERLAIDPNRNNILYFGARSGKGLWKSTDFGATWTNVTNFPSVGTYIPVPGDTNDYNTDIVGISWVTFDEGSGSRGSPTPRIFVGVANKGSNNVFVSENAGATWSAVAGQNTSFLPHKGVISPSERVLYISYSDGAGPYDGGSGAVWKYSITSRTWTNITPVSGSDLYFGFGGVAVDLQKPGTVMIAALNSWYPDGQIFRSTNGGSTWSPLWTAGWPETTKHYTYSNTLAPWLGPNRVETTPGVLQVGWMMEALAIDPFDSNHWLYGTGATIYGGRDLLQWDAKHSVTIKSLADGIEETAIQGLISPPTGPSLLSAVLDLGGFAHQSLTAPPAEGFKNPTWPSASDIDYAGMKPNVIVRVGTGEGGKQIAISQNSGATWSEHSGAPDNAAGGKVAISANGDSILWRTSNGAVLSSKGGNAFVAVTSLSGSPAIASDKLNNNLFYAASGSRFYFSEDGGATFVARSSLGDSTNPVEIAVSPYQSGDIWVTTDKGLFFSNDSGRTFAKIAGITEAWSVAVGVPRATGAYQTVFVSATIQGDVAYWRSDDRGGTWTRIHGYDRGFGTPSANCLTADSRVHGRVYIGTNGRGIFVGDSS